MFPLSLLDSPAGRQTKAPRPHPEFAACRLLTCKSSDHCLARGRSPHGLRRLLSETRTLGGARLALTLIVCPEDFYLPEVLVNGSLSHPKARNLRR